MNVSAPNTPSAASAVRDRLAGPDRNAPRRRWAALLRLALAWLAVATVGATDIILDSNAELGGAFTELVSPWTTWNPTSYNGDVRYAENAPAVTRTARWTATGLASGSYLVQVTWPADQANDVPFRVYDGATLRDTIIVDQSLNPDPDHTAGGRPFQDLSVAVVVSGTLVVEIDSTNSGWSMADAIRITDTADVVWVGDGAANLWSVGTNWAGGFVPSSIQVVMFDGTSSEPCNIDDHAAVKGVIIANDYAGTITQNSGKTITVGASGWVQDGGVFAGGDAAIAIAGDVTQTDGAFTATSSRMTVAGAFANSGGTFTHNNGTVVLAASSDKTLTNADGGSAQAFYDLTINDQQLVAYWPLDETAAATASADFSGNGHAGAASGAGGGNNLPQPSATVAPTRFASARSRDFDGTDDEITVPYDAALTMSTFSISAWIKASVGNNSWRPIVVHDDDQSSTVGGRNYWFGISGGGALGNEGSLLLTASTPTADIDLAAWSTTLIDDDAWHHVAAVVGGGTARVYLDGVLEGSDTYTPPIETGSWPLRIGRYVYDGINSYRYTGKIDDIRLYNRALNATEISALATGLAPRIVAATQTLAAALVVDHDLYLASGGLDVSATPFAVAVGGSWRNVGGLFTPRTGTVTLDGAVGGVIRSNSNAFNELEIDGAGTWTLNDRLAVDGTLTSSDGVLDVSASDHVIHAATINQTSGAGGIVPRSGTIVVDPPGARTLTVVSTLHDLRVEARNDLGLVAYWKLDDGVGAAALDSIGGNHGAMAGAPRWSTSTPSAIGFDDPMSLAFNGTSDRVAASRPMTATDNFTIAAWVKPAVVPQLNAMVVYIGDDSAGYGFSVGGADNNNARIYGLFGAVSWIDSGVDAVAGTWCHVALRRQSGVATVWVDGAENSADLGGGPYAPAALFEIGHQPNNGGRFFNGSVDDVRVYDRPLSDAEIRNLANGRYADGSGVSTPSETDLRGMWAFDDLTGTTAADSSGNGVTGTLINGPTWTASVPNAIAFDDFGCVVLDGVDDYVDLGTSSALDFAAGEALTICAWTKTTDDYGVIVSLRSSVDDDPVIDLAVGNSGAAQNSGHFMTIMRDDGGTLQHRAGGVINDGAWHHVALRRAADGTYTHFLDGASGGDFAGPSGAITTNEHAVGTELRWVQAGHLTMAERCLAGSVDDVRIYSRALSSAEIGYLAAGARIDNSPTSIALGGALAVGGTFALDSGVFNANGFATTVTDPFTLAQGGGRYLARSATQAFDGGFAITGSIFTGASGIVDIGGDFTQSKPIDANGGVAQSGGDFTAPSTSLKIAGSFTRASGAAFDTNGGEVEFDGAAAGKTIAANGLAFNDLKVSGAGAWTASGATTVADDYTQSAGTFTASAGDAISIADDHTQSGGTFAASTSSGQAIGDDYAQSGGTFVATAGTTRVAGGFANAGGTFTHSSGTVFLTSTANESLRNENGGGTPQAFYDLTINDGSLIGYWRLDDAASPAVDSSGFARDLTWQNSPTPDAAEFAPLLSANARSLAFNGTTQYLSIADSSPFGVGQVTVASWIYVVSGDWGAGAPVFNYQATGTTGYTLETSGAGGLTAYINVGAGPVATNMNGIGSDGWHHVAMTYDGTHVRLYNDGAQAGLGHHVGSLISPSGARASIGRNEYSGATFFKGRIDDVRV